MRGDSMSMQFPSNACRECVCVLCVCVYMSSHTGSIGGLFANPLVNPPEVAILAIGRVRQV